MTTNNTPRLGLMSPTDSDLFNSQDFATTFGKLDAVPGTTIVPNYASLPTNWGAAQHGSKVIQADNVAEWVWIYFGSGPGSWIRSNSIGILATAAQTSGVTTTLLGGGPTFLSTGNITVPGGRDLRIDCRLGLDNTSGIGGIVIVALLDNGNELTEDNYRVGPYINNGGVAQNLTYFLQVAPTPSTHNFALNIRCANYPAASGGLGTSGARGCTIAVSEV